MTYKIFLMLSATVGLFYLMSFDPITWAGFWTAIGIAFAVGMLWLWVRTR